MSSSQLNITLLKNRLISRLFASNIIQTGSFTLKSGKQSNIYIDMRRIVSYPTLFPFIQILLNMQYPEILANATNNTMIIGVPMGGIPFAGYISNITGIPALLVRDKPKSHGLCRMIEGEIPRDLNKSNLILIEDVMTTGNSIIEFIDNMRANSVEISEIFANNRYEIITILTRFNNDDTQILDPLINNKIKSLLTMRDIDNYLKNITVNNAINIRDNNNLFFVNSFANKLYTTAIIKKTNIIFACDEYDPVKIYNTICEIAPYICGIKIHSDLIPNSNGELTELITKIRREFPELIIIDDRKLADIGKIAIEQANLLTKGLNIDLLTAHALIGHSIYLHCDNLLMLAEMSCEGTLINNDYVERALEPLVKKWNIYNRVAGIICQNIGIKYLRNGGIINDIITISPGVNISTSIDTINQRYTTYLDNPRKTRETLGQFWIVGRGIYESENKLTSAMKYAEYGWEHFKNY